MQVNGYSITVSGRFLRTAKLRHEWFEYLRDPGATIEQLRQADPRAADLFTFVPETLSQHRRYEFPSIPDSAAILAISTYEQWWENLHFKTRNKIRKAYKAGVELHETPLDAPFVAGVKAIYDESPVRQGKRFRHYGKSIDEIRDDLGSFPSCSLFVGAYLDTELIGFMKLFEGDNILRTIHIISKINEREKAVQDALIAKAVEICAGRKIAHLHYGIWSLGGLGDFKQKHGFRRVDIPRYFIPITLKGKAVLKLGLNRPVRDVLPESWADRLITLRNRFAAVRESRKRTASVRPPKPAAVIHQP